MIFASECFGCEFHKNKELYSKQEGGDVSIETEHNVVVKIPPKRRYKIALEVKSIRKAKPKILEERREILYDRTKS